jgi:hypothetical protein
VRPWFIKSLQISNSITKMKAELTLIPHLTIHPDKICYWNEVNWSPYKPNATKVDQETGERLTKISHIINSERKAKSELSIIAKRKMSKAIDYLLVTSVEKKQLERLTGKLVTFKIAFVTLTLPSQQVHTDSEIISKCLNQLLTELRKYHNVKKFVWRAEKQKNGNIHFHLLTDTFIPWYELRNRWNRILNKLHYVDKFQEKHGHRTPNSTDVHSTRKIKNIKKYVTKYMQKVDSKANEGKLKSGQIDQESYRLWSCSQNLSKIKGCQLVIDNEIAKEITKIVNSSKCHSFHSSYFSVWYINYDELTKFGSDLLFKYFSNYLIDQFNFNLQLKTA